MCCKLLLSNVFEQCTTAHRANDYGTHKLQLKAADMKLNVQGALEDSGCKRFVIYLIIIIWLIIATRDMKIMNSFTK